MPGNGLPIAIGCLYERCVANHEDLRVAATIGRESTIAHFSKLRISGLVAWLLWGVAHVYFLVGFRNRVAVLIGWLWAYLTFDRGAVDYRTRPLRGAPRHRQ